MSNNTQVERERRAREIADRITQEHGMFVASGLRTGRPLPDAITEAVLSFNTEEVERLRAALRPFAERQTITEALTGPVPSEWMKATPERRIEMIGERKRKNDEDILRARTALGDTDHG